MLTDPPRVLVVDDNVDFARSLQQLLDALGYPASIAHDATTALLKALQERPQVVFLDLELGQENGSHVMLALRRMFEADHELTIVCVTGHATAQTELACRKAGFDLFLMKPVSVDLLREVMLACRARIEAAAHH